MIASRGAATAFVIAAAILAACSSNGASRTPTEVGGAHPLAEGETYGRIEHLPGGTSVATSVITLLKMACVNGQLVVSTNLKTITGKMDCAQEVPQAALEPFYGRSVSISYRKGRLRVESVSAGSLDVPLRDATSKDADATP